MRKFIYILTLIFILTGCELFQEDTLPIPNDISFSPEKLIYLKTFEQLEPQVNVIDENDERLLININCGLTDYTGIKVDGIYKEKGQYEIKIKGEKTANNKLSTPVVTLSVYKNENFPEAPKFVPDVSSIETYRLNYTLSELLKSLEAKLHYTSKLNPTATLQNKDDLLIWNINYKNSLDLETENLISLNITVDAKNMEVLSSSKNILAEKIKDGGIISIQEERYLFYKTDVPIKENTKKIEIFKYDLKEDDTLKIYQTESEDFKLQIYSKERISIIDNGNIYLYDEEKWNKLPQIEKEGETKPYMIRFATDGKLYSLISNPLEISLYLYDEEIDKPQWIAIANLPLDLTNITIGKEGYLTSYKANDTNLINYTSFETKNSKLIGLGTSPKIINNTELYFIETKEEKNSLQKVNIETDEKTMVYENVESFNIIDDDHVQVVVKSNNECFYSVRLINPKDSSMEYVGEVALDNINVTTKDHIIYGDIFFSVNNIDKQIIYKSN